MKKIITILFFCTSLIGQAQIIWNEVVTGYANTPYVSVTKVVMYDDRTEMTFHIDFVKGQWIRIAPNTMLQADGKDYMVKNATVLTLGESYVLTEDTLNFVLTFEPLPMTTKNFEFVEPHGWLVTNIRSTNDLPDGITNTYWRNEATGDWLIGFAPKHVIYNNKVWDIINQMEVKDVYTLMLSDGTTINISKMKKGLRTITVGNDKPIMCSPITKAVLPDYPMKDTRTGFVDNGYNPTDSVTIIGWLKDMPEQAWQQSKEFSVDYQNIMNNRQENAYTKMDSLGRFSFKVPLLNSTEVFIDWRRTTVNSFLEPGKTYFFLYDFKTGQKLWMGDDVRVQNELLALPRSHAEAPIPYNNKDADLMAYRKEADNARQMQMDFLRALLQSHPTMSQRYIDYMTDYFRMKEGRNLMQARFSGMNRAVPQEYMDYVGREFWQKAPKPYTLYRDFVTMNNDFLGQNTMTKKQEDVTILLQRFEKEGKVTLTADEKRYMEEYPERVKQLNADVKAAKTDEERKKIIDAYNNSEMVATLNSLLQRNAGLLNSYTIRQVLDVADSVGCDQTLRDIILAQRICQQIDMMRQPADSVTMAFAEQQIKMPAVLNIINNLNDKYYTILHRDISKSSSLKSADDVANMSDGEKILRRIIEPYKGKIILLDVWGTWCAPCKEALSHSSEEYERLKDFDIVFLYLANNSPDEAWKSVIKEYDILGDNISHYNLPADQQSAVEHFLGISAFPTYKLIDRNGTILDVNANPRNLETLVQLLEQL